MSPHDFGRPHAVPGVDVVLPCDEAGDVDALLGPSTRRLLGTLHRRLWDRRSTLLRERALGRTTGTDCASGEWAVAPFAAPERMERGADLCGADGDSFAGRLAAHAREVSDAGVTVVRVRGWDQTEAGMLVDGRATPGAVFDVALALSRHVDPLRDGVSPVWLCLPEVADEGEAALWGDLLKLAQDRLGIERGTVRLVLSVETDGGLEALDDAMHELRDHVAGVCIANDGVDEQSVKSACERRHGVFAGTIESSSAVTSLR